MNDRTNTDSTKSYFLSRTFGLHVSILAALCIFVFISVKAVISSFTIDESYTYLNFVHHPFMDILSHRHPFSNNHLMNSLLMKYSEQIFGSSELALRLPNLLLLIVFFIYSFLILKEGTFVLRTSVFIILITNIIVIDMFGVARGYGLSIGFMMMSLFHLIQSVYDKSPRHLVIFNFAASLAILSNATMLDYFVAGLGAYNIVQWLDAKTNNKKFHFFSINRINLIMLPVMTTYMYEPVRRIFKFNNFDFGGSSGIVSDTSTSLVTMILQGIQIQEWVMTLSLILLITFIFLPTLLILINSMKKKFLFNENKSLLIIHSLLLILILELVMQHVFFDTDYPVWRFAIFLYPLLIIQLFYILKFLSAHHRKIAITIAVSIAIASTFHFVDKQNLYSYSGWEFDKETKNAVIELSKYHTDIEDNKTVSLGCNWLFEPTLNFYRETMKLDWLAKVEKREPQSGDNYYYIFSKDSTTPALQNCDTLFFFRNTNSLLLSKKE